MNKVKKHVKKRKEAIHNIFSSTKPIHKRVALWIVLLIIIIDIIVRYFIHNY